MADRPPRGLPGQDRLVSGVYVLAVLLRWGGNHPKNIIDSERTRLAFGGCNYNGRSTPGAACFQEAAWNSRCFDAFDLCQQFLQRHPPQVAQPFGGHSPHNFRRGRPSCDPIPDFPQNTTNSTHKYTCRKKCMG